MICTQTNAGTHASDVHVFTVFHDPPHLFSPCCAHQMLPPVVMAEVARGASLADTKKAALTHLGLTHESRKLWGYAEVRVCERASVRACMLMAVLEV